MNRPFTLILVAALRSFTALAEPQPLPLFEETEPNLADLDTKLYPLGWSSDGTKLAILFILPWEATDTPRFRHRIIDLRSDKVVHEKKWDELEGIDFDDRAAGFSAFWKRHEKAIHEANEKHQIKSAPFKLYTFPGFIGERRSGVLSIGLKHKRARQPYGVIGGTSEGVQSYALELIQDGKAKQVYATSPEEVKKEMVYPMAVNVRGYLTNPQQDRIAILITLTDPGWEGPPHVRQIKVVGAGVGKRF